MLEYLRNKKILIVAAHPDDELLGLGATMNKLITEFNVRTKVVILGEGVTSRAETYDRDKWRRELETHKRNVEAAKLCIGYHEVETYDFADNRFDTVPLLDIVKVIENEKQLFEPEVVFTHHGGDLNIDHQRTFDAVVTACRPVPNEMVKTIIAFETPSGTEWRANADPRHFLPNFFVALEEIHVDAKIRGMESYEFEKRKYPHPRSPEALKIQAQRWGVVIGKKYAEAFQIIRSIH